MSKIFGGKAPRPSAQQNDLASSQADLARQQLVELKKQSALQDKLLPGAIESSNLQLQLLRDSIEKLNAPPTEAELAQQELSNEVLKKTLANLRRGSAATPEELSAIQESTALSLAAGESDISRFRNDSLTALGQELAPSLGLRPSDSPIIDRGGRIAETAIQQQGDLATSLQAAAAQARLNLPLARQQLDLATAQGSSAINLAASQFQQQLRDSAVANRLRIGSEAGGRLFNTVNSGLGLSGIAPKISGLFQPQQASKSGIGSLLSGAGGLLKGISAVAPLFASSDADAKDIMAVIDDDATFEAIKELPATLWKYKHDADNTIHPGPMAQDLLRLFNVGDGRTYNVIDAVGSLYVISRVLAKKIEDIQNGGIGTGPVSGEQGLGLAA